MSMCPTKDVSTCVIWPMCFSWSVVVVAMLTCARHDWFCPQLSAVVEGKPACCTASLTINSHGPIEAIAAGAFAHTMAAQRGLPAVSAAALHALQQPQLFSICAPRTICMGGAHPCGHSQVGFAYADCDPCVSIIIWALCVVYFRCKFISVSRHNRGDWRTHRRRSGKVREEAAHARR